MSYVVERHPFETEKEFVKFVKMAMCKWVIRIKATAIYDLVDRIFKARSISKLYLCGQRPKIKRNIINGDDTSRQGFFGICCRC